MSCIASQAQNVNAFAVAKSSRQSVLIEQPLKVTITVYTSTWFTQPLQIENLQVEGAFVQSFKQTQSAIKYVDKKKYACLEFYYIVFPYRDGELSFPALSIITETPPEGDFKGKLVTLKTNAIKVIVKPIPKDADSQHWLVANNASISSKWSRDIHQLKVGDVLERTITTSAHGTLPSFIDEPMVEDVDFGNIYTSEPKYIDERDSKSVNGKRIDTYSYLLEREGEFTIPEVELTWYNPYVSRFYRKKLAAVSININKNAELAGLVSLKDSLNALNPIISKETLSNKEEANHENWILLVKFLIIGIIALYVVIKTILNILVVLKRRRAKYTNSEVFWFKQVMQQSKEKPILRTLYQWLDHYKSNYKINTLNTFSQGDETLNSLLTTLKKNAYSEEASQKIDLNKLKSSIKKQRTNHMQEAEQSSNKILSSIKDINPR
ncbi:BatD family protein [Labilibacter marinus]|uniref:BatD family protein n=1 Tax=Labilibacter marinus TaxID=1477105 RepID=UPI0013013A83|nr:BatD family protein [Labilibacter marinus]